MESEKFVGDYALKYMHYWNYDSDLADISIPANDDAIASIRLILNKLVFAIFEGCSSYIQNS